MDSLTTPSIRRVFDREASLIEELDASRREEKRRIAFEELARDDRYREKERREEQDRQDYADLLAFLHEAELADRKRIDEFVAELDRYDALTIEALQDNDRMAAEVRERIRATLASAVQLPDGRHVFKTEDGHQVFDEHGAAVAAEEIRPEDIDDSRPRYGSYQADRAAQDALAKERQELLAFQERLDQARDKLGKDGLTNGELDALEKDIDAAMPANLRNRLNSEPEAGRQAMPRDGCTPGPASVNRAMTIPTL